MLMLTQRLQVLLDEPRFRRLRAEAERRKVPIAVLVREAIDLAFPVSHDVRSAAAVAILDAQPMPVPEPNALRTELDALRGRHG